MRHSYSDLLTFQRCPKQYEYKILNNIEKRVQDKKLALGIMVHELLLGYYTGQQYEIYMDLMDKADAGWLVDDEIHDAHDLIEQAVEYVQAYVNHHDDGEWEILHAEETFYAEVDDQEISFTPDLIIRDATGVWIVDHKTTAAAPSGALPVGDYQAFLYSAVVREIYPDFRGFIFNKIRKKFPREPRLTKTGQKRVADIGRIDTTYEVLAEFIVTEAPELFDDPTHKRRLAELKDNNRFFWREYVYVTEEMADEILEDTKLIAEMVDVSIAAGRFPRHFLPYSGAQACENCDYQVLCNAELRGYNTEDLLPLYQERDMSHRNYDHEEVPVG